MSEEVAHHEVEEVEQNDDTVPDDYTPLVKLEEVETDSGENEEECLYKQRAKLYRFSKEMNEWKERGLGDAKFLQHKEHKIIRFLMRQEKTLKVVANHIVNPSVQLKSNAGSDTSWVWAAQDFSEGELTLETFAIRFKTPEIAEEFKAKYDELAVKNKDVIANHTRKEKDDTPAEAAPVEGDKPEASA
jgi:Ran-binding protein 1